MAPIRPLIRPVYEQSFGSSTLVLLLPGLSGNNRQWEQVLMRLADLDVDFAFGAPILSHPALGERVPSIAELAGAFCKELDITNYRRILIVTHSVGSFVGFALAQLMPDRVSGLVVVNGGLATVARLLDHPLQQFVQHPRDCLYALRLFALVAAPVPRSWKEKIAGSRRASEALLGRLVSSSATSTIGDRRALIENAGDSETLKALGRNRHHWPEFLSYVKSTHCHVDLIVGELDPMASPRDADELSQLIPDVSVYVLPGVGHAAPIEAPDEIAAVVRECLGLGGSSPT